MAKSEIKTAQENVKVSVQGNIVTILIDASKDFGASKSGKSNIVASTAGFVSVGDGLSLNLNLVKKNK